MADLSITAENVLASATAKTTVGTAGATVTAGKTVYIDTADSNKLKLAQTTSTKYKAVGIALHGAASGQPLTYCWEDDDFTPGATVAVGEVYSVSDTAGGIRPVADNGSADYVSVIMVGKSTTKCKLNCSALGRADAAKA